MSKPPAVPQMVRQIVDRLHVSATEREVLRYVRSRLADPRNTPREWKRETYRAALRRHAENRDFYVTVMKKGW